MTIITRLGFCESCSKTQAPKSGQNFIAYGSKSKSFKVLTAQRNGKVGYVPFMYKLDKVLGENVVVLKSCAMYPCGANRELTPDNQWFYFIKEYERQIWTLAQWNSLVELKHNVFTRPYEI